MLFLKEEYKQFELVAEHISGSIKLQSSSGINFFPIFYNSNTISESI